MLMGSRIRISLCMISDNKEGVILCWVLFLGWIV